jgi:hypothetical protein
MLEKLYKFKQIIYSTGKIGCEYSISQDLKPLPEGDRLRAF